MPVSPKAAASEMLGVIPLVMRAVRAETRSHRALGLSVPQFRALAFVRRHPGASLSAAAEHVGVALPSMSRLIDGLVKRKLMLRRSHPDDRRRITLELTARGRALWQAAYDFAQASMTRKFSVLNGSQCATVVSAMRILLQLFAQGSTGNGRGVP
jgi:DNA-binding MarR family transcriptional regulator